MEVVISTDHPQHHQMLHQGQEVNPQEQHKSTAWMWGSADSPSRMNWVMVVVFLHSQKEETYPWEKTGVSTSGS